MLGKLEHPEDKKMMEAEALLVAAMSCFNEIPSKRVHYLENIHVNTTYNLAAKIDRYMRKKFKKNSHELTKEMEKTLDG